MDQSAYHQQQQPQYHQQPQQFVPQQQQQQYVDPNQHYHQQQQQQQQQQYHQQPLQHQHTMDPNQQQQQYQAQAQMMAVPPPPQDQEWNTPLCTCSPCGGCMLATCLPCILVGKTSERLVDPSLSKYEVFNPECLIMGGITYIGLGFVYAMIKRMEIRERFGIKGSGFGDFCASYWCACCVVLQNDNEVRSRVGEPGQGPVVQGYQQNPGMAMPSPAAPKN
ncbi:hypothetical protein MAPG_05653 [Magnaporthiopsis poae ATCC 64411]|uniref:PLAC8 family protein n=1 Tax=Magnaporthiopsis poae (strain ATCC 64411 / 73-15) TaxID=644358 RepID=A0A0C4DZZ0_MAGP6|nr:hypothetical protein MAPG_05653 [Magnaporthiopsis poae ATCC 64411]